VGRESGPFRKNEAQVTVARDNHWYLISYDVRDPRRLRRTAKHLEGYGVRLQYSLFRCRLGKRDLERLRWELTQILSPEDSILIICLCPNCSERVRRGNEGVWPEGDNTFEIV